MKTIIAGSRTFVDYENNRILLSIIARLPWEITSVVCGKARGADTAGEQWAKSINIPIDYYPAEWDKYGKRAGILRNVRMAENADALVAIWDGKSRGTAHMIKEAKKRKMKVMIFSLTGEVI